MLAGTIFDVYFGGQISTLNSIAQAPVVRATDEAGMLAYLKRVQPPKGGDAAVRDVGDVLSAHAEPEAPYGLRLKVELDGGEVRVTVDEGSARIV